MDATLNVQRIDIAPIAELVAKLGIGREDRLPSGTVNGDVQLSGNLSKLDEIDSWTAKGKLTLQDIAVANSNRYSASLPDFSLEKSRFVVPAFELFSSDVPTFKLAADADIRLSGNQQFKLSVAGDDIPATDLASLVLESPRSTIDGKLDIQGELTGELKPPGGLPPRLNCEIAIASPALSVMGVDLGTLEHKIALTSESIDIRPLQPSPQSLTIQRLSAGYQIAPDSFRVTDLDAELFGGEMQGNLKLARQAKQSHQDLSHLEKHQSEFSATVRLPGKSASVTEHVRFGCVVGPQPRKPTFRHSTTWMRLWYSIR